MRFVTFEAGGRERLGLVEGNRVLDLAAAAGGAGEALGSMLALLDAGDAGLDAARRAADAARSQGGELALPLAQVRLKAPIPRPRKNVVALGLNYRDHAEEAARASGRPLRLPEYPIFFTKPATAVIGPEDDVLLDERATKQLDYEVEFAVVLGKRCKNVRASEADDVIWGYTICNDVSARDLQFRHGQWFKGKSLDTTCPIGPYLVHKSAVPDPRRLGVRMRVNGQLRQSSTVDQLIFDVPTCIEYLSLGQTLEPGEIIITGTTSGVGFAMSPPSFLKDGDVMEAEVDELGVLRNRVRKIG